MTGYYDNDYYLKTIEHDCYKLHINFELKTIKSGTTINLKDLLYALKTAKGLGQKEIADTVGHTEIYACGHYVRH